MNVNKVLIAGNLCADPELKTLPRGTLVADFRIATNRRWKDSQTNELREDVCFIDVAAYGRQAELIRDFFHKGKGIFVEGRLRHDTWEKDGQRRSKHAIVLESFEFVGPKTEGAPELDSLGEGPENEHKSAEHQSAEIPRPAAPVPSGSAPAVGAEGSSVARRRRERALAGAVQMSDAEAAKLPF